MTGFYGGPNGQSFYISHVFNTRFGDGDSMENDLRQGWTSPFPIGSYVVISYGLPSDEKFKELDDSDKKYKEYYDKDAELGLKTYNSTFWKKVYNENDQTYNGISYELIASMTGATPHIEFVRPIDVLDPVEMPDIKMAEDSTVDRPKVIFRLPRGLKFYYGDFLGKRLDKVYVVTDESFADYGVGDYYINAPTGFIYLITAKQGNQVTFTYQACIQAPLPKVRAEGISPYTDSGALNVPTVVRNLTNDEGTAWELVFGLPKALTPQAHANFVGSLEAGSAQTVITNKDTVTFNFTIPSGSRIFAGDAVDGTNLEVAVPDTRPGDLYLNTDTGELYILQANGAWQLQQGSLQGPVGEALNVVRSYPIEGETLTVDSLPAGVDYIKAHYPGPYKTDELFAVTFTDDKGQETSYWYFYTGEEGNNWGRVVISSVGSIFEDEYTPSPDDDPIKSKGYAIHYINKLIGGEMNDLNGDKTTFSKKQISDLLSWASFGNLENGKPLFKIFKYTEDELKNVPCHAGQVYFTELEKSGIGGNIYVDIGDTPEDRKQVNAKYADALRKRKEDGSLQEVGIDDLLWKDMLIDAPEGSVILSGSEETGLKGIQGIGALYALTQGDPKFGKLPIEAGGTNADNTAEARENLSVYSKQEVRDQIQAATEVAYTHTIAANSWTIAGNRFISVWQQPALRCGAGPVGDVPPTITYTSNFEEYSKIERADGERGVGITFTTATKPLNDIDIIIIDKG